MRHGSMAGALDSVDVGHGTSRAEYSVAISIARESNQSPHFAQHLVFQQRKNGSHFVCVDTWIQRIGDPLSHQSVRIKTIN